MPSGQCRRRSGSAFGSATHARSRRSRPSSALRSTVAKRSSRWPASASARSRRSRMSADTRSSSPRTRRSSPADRSSSGAGARAHISSAARIAASGVCSSCEASAAKRLAPSIEPSMRSSMPLSVSTSRSSSSLPVRRRQARLELARLNRAHAVDNRVDRRQRPARDEASAVAGHRHDNREEQRHGQRELAEQRGASHRVDSATCIASGSAPVRFAMIVATRSGAPARPRRPTSCVALARRSRQRASDDQSRSGNAAERNTTRPDGSSTANGSARQVRVRRRCLRRRRVPAAPAGASVAIWLA